MMEEDQDLRFVCKSCNKRYPCGKSLGAHMRSHVIANSSHFDEKFEANIAGQQHIMSETKVAEFGNGQSSYGLRENPRKTWRAVDSTFPLVQERVCKQCGKGFQSMKALCGHMACHSEKDRGLKDDHSWTSENEKMVLDSCSDTEEGDDFVLRTRPSKSKKCKQVDVKSPSFSLANNGSSSVTEIDGKDQEEVAMCLMLLSKDSGNKGGVNSVVKSSDNNSVVLETKSSSIDIKFGKKEGINGVCIGEETPQVKNIKDWKLNDTLLNNEIAKTEDSDSGYFLDECAKAESDASVGRGVEEYGVEFGRSDDRNKHFRTVLRKEIQGNLHMLKTDQFITANVVERFKASVETSLKGFSRDLSELSKDLKSKHEKAVLSNVHSQEFLSAKIDSLQNTMLLKFESVEAKLSTITAALFNRSQPLPGVIDKKGKISKPSDPPSSKPPTDSKKISELEANRKDKGPIEKKSKH